MVLAKPGKSNDNIRRDQKDAIIDSITQQKKFGFGS